MKYRKYSNEFKKLLVEQLLSGSARMTEICRQYDVAKQVVMRWQKKYELGQLDNAPKNGELAAEIRIKDLEGLVGRLSMDNELLKKVLKLSCAPVKINANSSSKTRVYSEPLLGGAEC